MTDPLTPEKTVKGPATRLQLSPKEARLKAALRDNLRRRKAAGQTLEENEPSPAALDKPETGT